MRKARFAVVVSRFNEAITGKLLRSCLATLAREGCGEDRVSVVHVPGGFEIPWAVNEAARSGRVDAVIALGCVLKGQTPQNDYISAATYEHIQRISIETRVPCVAAVLAPNTYKQALARTRGAQDRGAEAAHAALMMAEIKISSMRKT
jgi:6,7-dimethyl-8-ribityllumazine synthase